jgi:hypothetical protein
MKRCILFTTLVSVFAFAQVQRPDRPELPAPPGRSDNVRLPNGKLQRDEILKADQERNLADAAELARLAAEVKEDIEKNDRYVVSVKTLKKLDDIAKLTRNIHGRLNRY